MPSILLINTGTFPNDATGDPLQTAFNKINANFGGLSGTTPLILGPPVTPPGGTTVTILGATPAVLPALAVTGQVSIAGPFPASGIALNVGGATNIAAPASGAALTVTGTATPGNFTSSFVGGSGQALAIGLTDGQAGNHQWQLRNGAISAGVLDLLDASAGASRLQINTTGNVAINAPTSGIALTSTAVASGTAARFTDASTYGLNITHSAAGVGPQINADAANTLRFAVGGTEMLTIASTGNVAIAAPSSGAALTVSGVAGGIAAQVISAAAGAFGLQINSPAASFAGGIGITQSGQSGISFYNPASTGSAVIQTNGADRLTVNSSGAVAIAAPGAGTALTVTGLAGNATVLFQAPNTAGSSFGPLILGGTNASDFNTRWVNAANAVEYMQIHGDGGITFGSPTGGDKGLGTLNCTGLFVNGVAVTVP